MAILVNQDLIRRWHLSTVAWSLAFFTVIGLFTSTTSAARLYEVEVLLFKQKHSHGDNESLILKTGRSVDFRFALDQAERRRSNIKAEPAIGGHLSEINTRLAKSPNYDVLYHVRWQQATAQLPHAPRVGISLPPSISITGIRGVFRLYATDLLFIDAILRFDELLNRAHNSDKTKQGSEAKGHMVHYFMKQQRRVKFKEIHYFDHPRFGIFLTVWPIDE